MWNPFAQYGVMRGSGCSVLFSLFAVLFFIVTMPYLLYSDWRHSKLTKEEKSRGTWDELLAQRDETGLVKRTKK
jgi:hypothetical protein